MEKTSQSVMLDRTLAFRSQRRDVYHNSVFFSCLIAGGHTESWAGWKSSRHPNKPPISPPDLTHTHPHTHPPQSNNTHKLPNEARQSTHTLLSLSQRSEIAHTLKTHTQAHPINPPHPHPSSQTHTQRSNGPPWGGGGGGGIAPTTPSPSQILHVAQLVISTTLSIGAV